MYVLSRLPRLTVVTWRKGIEDPIREWGQLLAYLPQVKRRCLEAGGRVILLPAPSLGSDAFFDPKDKVGSEARTRGASVRQVRAEVRAEIEDWLRWSNEPTGRFDALLGHRSS
jgi:hypothetical protein